MLTPSPSESEVPVLRPDAATWADRLERARPVHDQAMIWREEDGRIIKRFRSGKRRHRGAARRFLAATRGLQARGIPTVSCRELVLGPGEGETAVVYDALEGTALRHLVAHEGAAALRGLSAFVRSLHERGVYFRGAHLGNLLRLESGGLALIDVDSARFRAGGLSLPECARNLVHLLGNGTDLAFWTAHRVERFLDEYVAEAAPGAMGELVLRQRVAFGLRRRRARVDLHDKVPTGPKIAPAAERISVVLPERLGDAIMALNAFGYLAARRPNCEFVAIAPSGAAAELAGRQPLFARVLHDPPAAELRALGRRSELVLDLHGNDRTEALARAHRAPILTAKRRDDSGATRHQVEWLIGSLADFVSDPVGTPPPFRIGLRDDDRARASRLLRAGGIEEGAFVLVHLGVGRYVRRGDDGRPGRGRRRWPVSHFAEVALHLARHRPDLNFVLTGMGAERELDAAFARQVPRSLALGGEADLGALAALSAAAELVLCADTGPMHLAAALTDRLLAVFLDTDRRTTGPYPMRTGHRLLQGQDGSGPGVGEVAAAAVEIVASSREPRRHILEADH